MGSLMAGWDSPTRDPDIVKFRRNKSLTKEGIESFWKSKKEKEEEHLRDISLLSPRSQKTHVFEDEMLEMENETNLEKLTQKKGWWVSSNCAFLNEPPVIAQEETERRYASPFHATGRTGGQ